MRLAVVATFLALTSPTSADTITERIERVAHVFDDVTFELVPSGLTERLVRWQRTMRDFVHHAADGLAFLADQNALRIADVSILTTEPVEKTTSSGFGWRDDPIRHRAKFHTGADFRGKRGTPVLASGPGVVVFAGRRGGYGNLIEIDHGGGVITRYAHLSRIVAKEDVAVVAGQPIGTLGSTGRTTGPHLHFEVRLDNRPVDPNTAFVVAELMRESPEMGKLAAFALVPEVQGEVSSEIDPPKSSRPKKKDSRPDRTGRVRVAKPLS